MSDQSIPFTSETSAPVATGFIRASKNFKSRTVSLKQLAVIAENSGLALADLLSPEGPAHYTQLFEADGKTPVVKNGEDQYKRTKGVSNVSYEHNLKEVFAGLSVSAEVKTWLEALGVEAIVSFIRSEYVDQFKPVGDHSLETIAKAFLENQSGSDGVTLTAEDYKVCSEWLGRFMANIYLQLGQAQEVAEQVGTAFSTAGRQKFSLTALARITPNYNDAEFLNKVVARISAFSDLVQKGIPQANGENNLTDEQIEKFTAVCGVWIISLNKQIKDLTAPKTIDISMI